MTDTKWTFLSAVANCVSAIVSTAVGIRRAVDNDPGIHERVALLERDMQEMKAKTND